MTADAAAIVTGHSRGIGAAIAEHLLGRDVAVMGVARGENADLGKRFGPRLAQVRLDLGDAGTVARWLSDDAFLRFFDGRANALLVNNAGVLQPIGPLETQTPADVARAVTVNVAAALMFSAAFVGATARTGERRILHISSGAASRAYAGWSVYCATKAALDHHARAVSLDQTPALRICSIAPGVVDTEMQAEVRASSDTRFPDRERFVAMKREGRLLDPGERGGAIVEFLLSRTFGAEPVTDLRAG